jgi:hypothetical protein
VAEHWKLLALGRPPDASDCDETRAARLGSGRSRL